MVIDAVALIAPSGESSPAEVQGMRQWFAAFADWMVNSETGHEEDVLSAATADPKSWTLYTNEEKTLNPAPMIPVLLQAERAYGNGAYARVLDGLPASLSADLHYLLWPIKPK